MGRRLLEWSCLRGPDGTCECHEIASRREELPPVPTGQRFLESILEDKPQTAAAKLKASITGVLAGDRRTSIELQQITQLVKNAKGPADKDSQEAEMFDRFVASLQAALDGEASDEAGDANTDAGKIGAIQQLLDMPTEATRFAESILDRDHLDRGRRLAEAKYAQRVEAERDDLLGRTPPPYSGVPRDPRIFASSIMD